MTGARVIRAGDLCAQPWANGGGVTRVIADVPGVFRLSLATIDRAGAFSRFAGVWRWFAVVEGRVSLDLFDAVLDAASDPVGFSGEVPVFAVPEGGAVLAFNLMGGAELRLSRVADGAVDARAVFACGAVAVDGVALGRHDSLVFDDVRRVRVIGPALVVG